MNLPLRISTKVRHGLSVPEVFGCLVALVAGVLIGAMYLGVDVRAMARGIFEDADEKAYTDSMAELDAAADAAAEAAQVELQGGDNSAVESETQNNSQGPGQPGATGESSASSDPSANQPASEGSADASEIANAYLSTDVSEVEEVTIRYWHELTVALQNESEQRNAVKDSGNDWQLFDHLSHRRNNHQTAVDALEELESRGVDDRVLEFAERAQAWHEAGVTLYSRAVDLLTDGPAAQLSGPYAQSWQSAATQHRMEERLLLDRQRAVHQYLRHRRGAP